MIQQQNPLLEPMPAQGSDNTRLPAFSQIKPEHVETAIQTRIANCKAMFDQVIAAGEREGYHWDNFVAPLEQVEDELDKTWAPISHMNAVVSSKALRAAHDACLPMLSEFATYAGQHEGLYKGFLALHQSAEFAHLTPAQQRVITETLRDFELSGVALPSADKQRYAEIQARLAELGSTFSNNLLDATDAWHHLVTDEGQLTGLPQSAVMAAAELAQEHEQSGWRFTLDIPSYLPVMTYADSDELRKTMYQAYVTRASEQGPNAGQFDNSQIMEETLTLRQELAQLLGFANYAELSLATKMAESPLQVQGFLTDLAEKSLPQARAEYQQVLDFARTEFNRDELEAWDIAYYSEKLKQQAYAISDEELRPYFPEHKVVKGLFQVVEKLFGIRIQAKSGVDVWHPHASYYEVYDQQQQLRAGFYFDLYARPGKRGGAWMAECQVRRRTSEPGMQLPVAYLTCNLNKPVGDQPALFTHDEVVTLFHEFGHGLHHMLTQIDVAGVSGINGVAWDAVELPSQFLENWCWEPEALALLSGHYETGESLPAELLEKMLAARNFQAAMQMVRQLEFSLFDMAIHADPTAAERIADILQQIRSQVAVRMPPAYNRFQHSFGHIFAGGYAAGYYSYKWAEVLSADAFARFEEEGVFNQQTGQDFLRAILERGGSADAMDLFREFRGREPSIEPLLRHSGIAA